MAMQQTHAFDGKVGSQWVKDARPKETSFRVHELVSHGCIIQSTKERNMDACRSNGRACDAAKEAFRVCGLRVPAVWCEPVS